MNRRRFVAMAASIGALAGCTGDEDDGTPTPEPTSGETATDPPEDTDTPADTDTPTATDTATDSPDVAAEVTVAPNGDFRFDPSEVTVQTGETVRWVWDSGGHNVKPNDIPDESDWTGSPGGRSETQSAGFEYSHTFEVAGTYDYVCVPHESVGMTGTVIVE